MSDTTRRHESTARSKRRGPKNRNDENFLREARLKSHKQLRVNDKVKIRRSI